MSECCVIPHTGAIPTCPMNAQITKPVGRRTVESLIKPEVKSALIPQPYHFCCQGCVDLFITDPEKYLLETSDLIVCPTCLAEKPLNSTVKLKIGEQQVHFCRCPYCLEVFRKAPDYYLTRLQGEEPSRQAGDREPIRPGSDRDVF